MKPPLHFDVFLARPGHHSLNANEDVTGVELIAGAKRGVAILRLQLGPRKSLDIPMDADALEGLCMATNRLHGLCAPDIGELLLAEASARRR